MDKQEAIKILYNLLKEEIVEIVEGIEGGIPTTQNQYGAYMSAINSLQSALESTGANRSVVGQLLIMGGGNAAGIRSALTVMGD